MLKGVHPLLGPDILGVLGRAGHGDVIALVDRNYPAYSAGPAVVRLDGVDTTTAMRVILGVLPIDTYGEHPLLAMDPGDHPMPDSHGEVLDVAVLAEGRPLQLSRLERFAFYEACRSASAIIVTSDDRPFSCFLVRKGVV